MVEASRRLGFPMFDGLQCMVERRKGGETGVKAVQLIEGDAVWKAADQGRWSRDLLEAAFSRSDTLLGVSDTESRPQNLAHNGELPKLVPQPRRLFHRVPRRLKGHLTHAQRRPEGL